MGVWSPGSLVAGGRGMGPEDCRSKDLGPGLLRGSCDKKLAWLVTPGSRSPGEG
jgi:hypothetical protein